ncbi:MAG TPA: MFS transporter, partial [Thermoplasmataceae archaeon]|nr:MFS transporter [Thermoplasmataceae archaeon]
IDTTIVILALPTITGEFQSSLFDSIWTIIIYLLVVAVLTTQFGSLGDLYGRARIFNLGFLVFIIGSAGCALSPDIYYLISLRALQAVGAALMQANSSAIVADYFDVKERGRAFGYTTFGWNVGGTLGIVLGGVITTFIGWRYIFFINVPIGAIGLLFGLLYIKDNERKPSSIDFGGMITLGMMLGLISYGATDIAGRGVNIENLVMIALGLLLIPLFVIVEGRARKPIIDVRAFREKALSSSLISAFLQALGYLSVVFIIIMYLQGIRRLSPLDASLLLVPGYVIASFIAPRMGRLSDKVGTRTMSSLGIMLMAAGVLIYFALSASSSFYIVIAASLVSGVGGALFWPSNNSAVMSSAPRTMYGSISGLLRTLSSIGTLLSYVISISVAAVSVPRYVAFEVFLGTGIIDGKITAGFMSGIHSALLVSFVLLIAAGIFSALKFSKLNEKGSGVPGK